MRDDPLLELQHAFVAKPTEDIAAIRGAEVELGVGSAVAADAVIETGADLAAEVPSGLSALIDGLRI